MEDSSDNSGPVTPPPLRCSAQGQNLFTPPATAKNLEWLTPHYEWDFRTVIPELSRLACLWEYARSDEEITSDPQGWRVGKDGSNGKGANTALCHWLLLNQGVLPPWAQMHDVKYCVFSNGDIKNLASLARKLQQHADPLSSFLWSRLSTVARQNILSFPSTRKMEHDFLAPLISDLNAVIRGKCLHEGQRFAGVKLEFATSNLLDLVKQPRFATANDIARLNRMLLEDAYPDEIRRGLPWQPQTWWMFDVWSSPATHIRSVREVKAKIKEEIASGESAEKVLDKHLQDLDYIVFACLPSQTCESIVAELEVWMRKEKNRFNGRRGKAAHPHYDYLKWLAAYRIEQSRERYNACFADLKTFLQESDRGNTSGAPTLPIYNNYGAWSKAVRRAECLLNWLRVDPQGFELNMLYL